MEEVKIKKEKKKKKPGVILSSKKKNGDRTFFLFLRSCVQSKGEYWKVIH